MKMSTQNIYQAHGKWIGITQETLGFCLVQRKREIGGTEDSVRAEDSTDIVRDCLPVVTPVKVTTLTPVYHFELYSYTSFVTMRE